MTTTQSPKVAVERVSVEAGAIVRREFPLTVAIRVVRGSLWDATLTVGQSPANSNDAGYPLTYDGPIPVHGQQVFFDFRNVGTGITYEPILLELYAGPIATWGGGGRGSDLPILSDYAEFDVDTVNTTGEIKFTSGANERVEQRYLTGAITGTDAFLVDLECLIGTAVPTWSRYLTMTSAPDGLQGGNAETILLDDAVVSGTRQRATLASYFATRVRVRAAASTVIVSGRMGAVSE